MSNRALAIIGFVIFMVVFWYQTWTLNQSVDEMRWAVLHAPSPPAPQIEATSGSSNLDTVAFLVENELEYLDSVVAAYVVKTQPDLKPEVRYHEFEKLVFQKRGAHGRFRWKPLKTTFGTDYDALAARFHSEYPTTEIPAD